MTGAELRDVLLVRAAEECRPPGHPGAIPPEALVDAGRAAGSPGDVERWLARRAAFLLAGPLADLRPVRAMTGALRRGLGLVFALATTAGLLSNYLGPSSKIHVLFNPIALLIVWNVGTYLASGIVRLVWIARGRPRLGLAAPGPSDVVPERPPPRVEGPGLVARIVFQRLVPAAWLRIHRHVLAGAEQASDLAQIARRFWRHWIATTGAALIPLARRALHVAAIGLALGAVAGMYARGLVFEYDVVWRSTFLTDPEGFLGLVRSALGPAAWLLGRPLPSAADAARLLTREGAPAAQWIHLWATSAVLFIVLPRTLLALWATARARRLERRAGLSLDDPYVVDLVARAREHEVGEVRARIDDDVRAAAGRFADEVGSFVCTHLYDAELAPAIRAFREEGGAVSDLERELAARCEAFRPTLAAEMPRARRAFEADLTARVLRRLGVTPSPAALDRPDVAVKVDAVSGDASRDLGGSLGHGLADTVAGAVTIAVAAVAGTVSGGFGEALGVAVLAGLLESGPIGWLVGALAGLLAAGAGWWLGRDALARGLKQVSLPGMVTRTILWQSRLDGIVADGRERCHARVHDLVAGELADLTADIAEEIWTRIKPVLGERQRPRIGIESGESAGGEPSEHPEGGE